MQARKKLYTTPLTDKDRVKVRITILSGEVIDFSVQYEALIDSSWRKIERYDSAHGTPHRHVFHADSTQHKHAFPYSDNAMALSEALKLIKKSFQRIRQNYIVTRGAK